MRRCKQHIALNLKLFPSIKATEAEASSIYPSKAKAGTSSCFLIPRSMLCERKSKLSRPTCPTLFREIDRHDAPSTGASHDYPGSE